MLSNFSLEDFLIGMIVIILSIALHEFGHAYSADRLGDPTPRRDGRVTLWPDKHFEPFGFIMILITQFTGFGLGWGKPVLVNTRNFRNPRRDMLIVTACGPLMNLILAVVFAILLRIGMHSQQIDVGLFPDWMDRSVAVRFGFRFVLTNLGLMFFNLIPIPPLDGSKILFSLLPYPLAVRYESFMGQFGSLLLILLIVTRATSYIIGPVVWSAVSLLLGFPHL